MTARSIRRAAERKAKKATEKEPACSQAEETESDFRIPPGRQSRKFPTFYRPAHPGRQGYLFHERRENRINRPHRPASFR